MSRSAHEILFFAIPSLMGLGWVNLPKIFLLGTIQESCFPTLDTHGIGVKLQNYFAMNWMEWPGLHEVMSANPVPSSVSVC